MLKFCVEIQCCIIRFQRFYSCKDCPAGKLSFCDSSSSSFSSSFQFVLGNTVSSLPPSLCVPPCCHQPGVGVLTALFSPSSPLLSWPLYRAAWLLPVSKSVSRSRRGFLAALVPPTALGQLLFGSTREGVISYLIGSPGAPEDVRAPPCRS